MLYNRNPKSKWGKSWKISIDDLKIAVEESQNFTQLLKRFNICPVGSSRNAMISRLRENNISTEHFKIDNKGRKFDFLMPKDECLKLIFINESTYSPTSVKKYLRKYNLICNDMCSICHMPPIWNNKLLVFQIDHIDGDNKNHSLMNLRWVCPNCHTQTGTFSGKNK
jgi:hypothetical protein